MRKLSLNLSQTRIVIAILIVLLPVLAALQFRWLGQISAAERDRVQENWRAGSSDLARDFDRELARMFLHFQQLTGSEKRGSPDDYDERYATWLAEAPYPRLIASAWLVRKSGPAGVAIERFTREGTLEPADWPAELVRYREQFARDHEPPVGAPAFSTGMPAILDEVPAIVSQLTEMKLSPFGSGLPQPVSLGHAVLLLDESYIAGELLPALVQRRLGGSEQQVAVVTRGSPPKVIYRSDPGFDPGATSPDVSAPLFSLRFEEFDDLISGTGAHVVVGARTEREPRKNMVLRFFRRAVPGNGERPEMDDSASRWQVIVQHRSGSLEAAVFAMRTRNVAISFGILALLAGSVGVLLVSAQRAERLGRQQMDFVAGVSHELRTPLAVIRSAGANLADGVISETGQVRRYGALIENEGRRLTQMVDQVLDFAAGTGMRPVTTSAVDIAAVIRDVMEARGPGLAEDGFNVRTDISPGLPAVAGDASALSRTLHNLLSNAQKYSPDRKSIRVTAGKATGPRDAGVVISVADCGIGISADDLPHVFEPFYRGSSATESQIKGSGLGLSLVKQTVEAHGGSVSVQSREHEGATFTIHLPAAPPREVATTAVPAPQATVVDPQGS